MWTKISDDVASLPRPQQDVVIDAANAERERKVLAHNAGRHRTQAPGVSRRVIALLSAAVLAGSGIAWVATMYGLLP